jgi:hypothetical protein
MSGSSPEIYCFRGMESFQKKAQCEEIFSLADDESEDTHNDVHCSRTVMSKQRLTKLRALDSDSICRTVFHDLATPHRAFIFPSKQMTGKIDDDGQGLASHSKSTIEYIAPIPWRLVSSFGVNSPTFNRRYIHDLSNKYPKPSNFSTSQRTHTSTTNHEPSSRSSIEKLTTSQPGFADARRFRPVEHKQWTIRRLDESTHLPAAAAGRGDPRMPPDDSDLAGPFHQLRGVRTAMAVNILRTFEANLERTIKLCQPASSAIEPRSTDAPRLQSRARRRSVQHSTSAQSRAPRHKRNLPPRSLGSPRRRRPCRRRRRARSLSKVRLDRAAFPTPSTHAPRSHSSAAAARGALDRINDELARRGERSASSLGFAPNRSPSPHLDQYIEYQHARAPRAHHAPYPRGPACRARAGASVLPPAPKQFIRLAEAESRAHAPVPARWYGCTASGRRGSSTRRSTSRRWRDLDRVHLLLGLRRPAWRRRRLPGWLQVAAGIRVPSSGAGHPSPILSRQSRACILRRPCVCGMTLQGFRSGMLSA